jgi:hypothetical protein
MGLDVSELIKAAISPSLYRNGRSVDSPEWVANVQPPFILQDLNTAATSGGIYVLIHPRPRNRRHLRQIDKVGNAAHSNTVLPRDDAIKHSLPFVNLVYSSWVSDLNYSPHLRGCVHAASRFSQETGIVLIRHNEEAIAIGEVQFHRSTLEHFLK